ncbi:nitroreductase family protein [Verrucomicrobiaceae bacterium N1E253]|uniref:Nitroreductase family protein n=1 Tax=Oceaniferula marina TaxID=2748318 RepID=A0A851GEF1_9BACT|nr:nitroreductase family protein [Oceaniferula marina]NWK55923.1 nitroreductase family protein [Oceaniferula marina]
MKNRNECELTTRQAIARRRSIRKFLPDDVNDAVVMELLEAARLAPSGCNSQPWRFKLVREAEVKERLSECAYGQEFLKQAPVVLVCCADIQGYLDGRASGVQDLGKIGAFTGEICEVLNHVTKKKSRLSFQELSESIAFNVAIAGEHIALRALDFGLGTCWIRLMDANKVRQLFSWDNNIYPVALIPIGIPSEQPAARKRKELHDLMID